MKNNSILDASDDALVCYCGNVTKGMILAAVANGYSTFQQLREATGVCPDTNDCANNNPSGKCCSPEVMTLLKSRAGAVMGESCGCGCCTNKDS
ncbi:(2Fe-2S)-binding protein [Oleidesulfovibrio alaskensis]